MSPLINSYASVLRRRLLLIVHLTFLLTVLGVLAFVQRPLTYASTAVLEVSSGSLAESVIGQTRGYEEPARRLATEVEVLRSAPVAEAASELLRAQDVPLSPAAAAERLEVTPRGASNYIDVTATGETPGTAQQVAAAFVTAYFDHRRGLQQAEFEGLASQLQAQLASSQEALRGLPADVTPGTPAAFERAAVVNRIQSTTELLEAVRLRSSVETSAVRLQSAASLPERPQGVSLAMAVAVSLFCAFFLSLAIALLVELWQDVLRTRDEAEQLTGAPVLTTVGPSDDPEALTDPANPAFASARALRLRLQALVEDGGPSRVLITALAEDRLYAENVARLLLVADARAGGDVLLLSDGNDSECLEPGAEHMEFHGVVSRRSCSGVWSAPLTTTESGGPGVVDVDSLGDVLDDLGQRFRSVVIVAPQSSETDVLALTHFVPTVLLVLVLGRTPARRLRRLAGALGRGNPDAPHGLVLVARRRRPLFRGRKSRHGAIREVPVERPVDGLGFSSLQPGGGAAGESSPWGSEKEESPIRG